MNKSCMALLFLLLSSFCYAQNQSDEVGKLALNSRAKADRVLEHFDTLHASKLLYSIDDKYYYIIIESRPCHKEYFIVLDSTSNLEKLLFLNDISKNKKDEKKQKEYTKLIKGLDLFDFSKYHENFITRMPDAKFLSGKLSYFVVKDINDKRYGEFSLSTITIPTPINENLLMYLIRRTSDAIEKQKPS